MIEYVYQLLYQICEDEAVYNPDINLWESGILDSFGMIELFYTFEDLGIDASPTTLKKEEIQTPQCIADFLQRKGITLEKLQKVE